MSKTVICLVGLSGSGKSTIARILRRTMNIPFFSIGHELIAAAKRKGLDSRTYAKGIERDLGRGAPLKSLVPQMQRLAETRGGIIIEGLLSLEDMKTISATFKGDQVFLFSVKRPRELRKRGVMKRMRATEDVAEERIKRYDKIRTQEYELGKLEQISDNVIINEFSNVADLYKTFEKSLKGIMLSRILSAVLKKKQAQAKIQARARRNRKLK